jgi:hypothetical protein
MGLTPTTTQAPGTQAADEPTSEDELTPEQSEAQMRRALDGLSAGAAPRPAAPAAPTLARPTLAATSRKPQAFTPGPQRKHRFVQDGEVKVVHLSLPKERPREAAAAEAEQRGQRERAERVVQEHQAMLRGLQTKLAHAEIALREALQRANVQAEAANAARAELAAMRAELQTADKARLSLEQRLVDQRAALEAEFDRLRQEAAQVVPAPPPPAAEVSEPVAEASGPAARPRAASAKPRQKAAKPRQSTTKQRPAAAKPRQTTAKAGKAAAKPRQPRPRPPEPPESEQEPVKWWLNTKPAKPPGRRAAKPG